MDVLRTFPEQSTARQNPVTAACIAWAGFRRRGRPQSAPGPQVPVAPAAVEIGHLVIRKISCAAVVAALACSLVQTAVPASAASASSRGRASAIAASAAKPAASCSPKAMPGTTTERSGMNNGGSGYKPSKVSMTIWKACTGQYYASATVFKASDGWYFKADASKPGFLTGEGGIEVTATPGAVSNRNSCVVSGKACDSPRLTPKGNSQELVSIVGTFTATNGVFDDGTDYFDNAGYVCAIGQSPSGSGIPVC